MSENIPLFPVTEWKIGPIPSMQIIAFRPSFLSHSMQPISEAQPSRFYALTPAQARDLISEMQKALHVLESTGYEAMPGEKH
jgi:hypothetical protein